MAPVVRRGLYQRSKSEDVDVFRAVYGNPQFHPEEPAVVGVPFRAGDCPVCAESLTGDSLGLIGLAQAVRQVALPYFGLPFSLVVENS